MSDEQVVDGGAGAPVPVPVPAKSVMGANVEVQAATDWKAGLPADIRAEASLADIKDIASLAKSYVHAQKMVGVEKLPMPKDNWTPEQHNEFWAKLGRPETPDGYKVPEVPDMPVNKEAVAPYLKAMHEAGLTGKQAEKVLGFYMNEQAGAVKKAQESFEQSRQAGEQALRQEWGNDFNLNVAKAQSIVRQFGNEDLLQKIEASGLGNDPAFIKMMAKAATPFVEDNGRADGSSIQLPGAAKSQAEINNLRMDKDFMKTLTDRNQPGHKQALEKWNNLFRLANPDQRA
jgi:hypothetical protein